jgi:hypothetical protein
MHEWKSSAYSFQIPRRASLQNHQKHAFLPASSRIFSGLLLGLIGLCFIAAAGEVVTWQAGSAYSDTFLYNGFAYKTIRIFNTNDTRLSISMAAALGSRPSPSTACLR